MVVLLLLLSFSIGLNSDKLSVSCSGLVAKALRRAMSAEKGVNEQLFSKDMTSSAGKAHLQQMIAYSHFFVVVLERS